MVPFEEPQIPSYVADSQPPLAEKVVDMEVGQCSEQPQFAQLGSSSESTVYSAIMNVVEYSKEALMAALSHLVDHKAQGANFVAMADAHRPSGLGTTCPSTTTI
jgi:hypothetical protein